MSRHVIPLAPPPRQQPIQVLPLGRQQYGWVCGCPNTTFPVSAEFAQDWGTSGAALSAVQKTDVAVWADLNMAAKQNEPTVVLLDHFFSTRNRLHCPVWEETRPHMIGAGQGLFGSGAVWRLPQGVCSNSTVQCKDSPEQRA